MATSLVYRSPLLYELFIMFLYGRRYFSRYRAVAELIPAGASVVDLCCGPAVLYDHFLRHRAVCYTGLDINPRFIARLRRRGGHGEVWDLHSDQPLPPADYVIMQGGLLYFLPDPAPLVERMLQAARKQVIVSEAIRNLATSQIPVVAWIARRSTDAGLGAAPQRFTEATLDTFFAAYASRVSRCFLIPGGREKVYVLNKEAR
jgi:SAM-dependent methyltransferase